MLVARMIVASLLVGVVIFALVTAMLVGSSGWKPVAISTLSPAIRVMLAGCAVLMVVAIPAGLILRRVILRRARDPQSGEVRAEALLPAALVPAAMFESFGLLGLFIVLLSRTWWPAGVFPIVSILGIGALLISLGSRGSGRGGVAPGASGYAAAERWDDRR